MRSPYRPQHIVLAMLAGWLNQEQERSIAYLREENRTLRAQLGGRRPKFTDLHGCEARGGGAVHRRARLGGRLNHYYREAA